MATKRRRLINRQIGISPAAIEAWRIGDYHGLNRALGIMPHQESPFHVDREAPPDWMRPDEQNRREYWAHAWDLRCRLLGWQVNPAASGAMVSQWGQRMPTKRRRIGAQRHRHMATMPAGVQWWLHHGQPLGIAQAQAVDLTERDAWQASALHFDRVNAQRSAFWTRRDCREAGYGAAIDAHVAAGKCPPDGWRG